MELLHEIRRSGNDWKQSFRRSWRITNGHANIVPGRMVLIGRQVGEWAWTIYLGLRADEHINWDNGHLTWVDATFQAILSAKILLQIATLLGKAGRGRGPERRVSTIEGAIPIDSLE